MTSAKNFPSCTSTSSLWQHSKTFSKPVLAANHIYCLELTLKRCQKLVLAEFEQYCFELTLKRLRYLGWAATQQRCFETKLRPFQNSHSRYSTLLLPKQRKTFPKLVFAATEHCCFGVTLNSFHKTLSEPQLNNMASQFLPRPFHNRS